MNVHAIVEGLNINDKKVLVSLQQLEGKADVEKIARQADMDQAAVMRGALYLSERGMVKIIEERSFTASLTPEGWEYAEEGLPERRMLMALASCGSEVIDEVAARAGLSEQQKQIALAWLKRRGWAEFVKRDERTALQMTERGAAALSTDEADEELLERLASRELDVGSLDNETRERLDVLVDRKLAKVDERARRELEITEFGRQAVEAGLEIVGEVSGLTHELIQSGKWREAKLKRYDVLAPVAPVYPGKIHPQQKIIDEIREILLEMGFLEIKSRIVDSEFWNFDALFQAQDHPAREIHDSLSLSRPEKAKLPPEKLLKKVAAAHEGGVAGSSGWGYNFNPEISQRPVLCSQTTAATVRYLASKPEPPVKVFCIDRVYRHEKIDYKHLAEFYQCEGIVMNEGLTLRDMLGYLKQVVTKLGLPKIRFRPGMFPFTEPSVEADVYHEGRKEWIEILGAGLFRPEVLQPLGIRYPVLAWGIGLTRLITIRLELDDIRNIFSTDLNWISNFVLSTKNKNEDVTCR
ncbi:MAG: phenylalanine--tRNA ligase subunit alpha [Candidatus Hadarchaeota archaeon]